MKPRFSNQPTNALTRTEVLVVIVVMVVGIGLLFPAITVLREKARRIACVNNLKEIDEDFRCWLDDHGKYPGLISVTNGGVRELLGAGNAYLLWQNMFSEFRSSPKVLTCPSDTNCIVATNFSTAFSDANISYFINLEAVDTQPQMVLDGDDNLLVNGKPVQPGILNLWTNTAWINTAIGWTKDRHRGGGNMALTGTWAQQVTSDELKAALADGSVQRGTSVTSNGFKEYFIGIVTNRLLIP